MNVLKERGETHGPFNSQFACAQHLKGVMRDFGMGRFSYSTREALEMIATKLSRILVGDPEFDDHWRDIAGYATLMADRKNTDGKTDTKSTS